MDKKFFLTLFLFPIVPCLILFLNNKKIISISVFLLFFILGLLCLIFPNFKNKFKTFLKSLGILISKITLFIGYWLIVVPSGIIAKIFNRDKLKIKKQKTESYWIDEKEIYDYERQF